MNDVFSPAFESKLDDYFTSKYQQDRNGRFSRIDKDEARSMLAPTRKPRGSKFWGNAQLGVSSPVRKNV